jgi:hypothetical protein
MIINLTNLVKEYKKNKDKSIMDRIYTVDTKLITLFHRYAKENGIKNIYEHRKPCSNRILTAMSPGNWTKKYDDNYKVDLDWIPSAIDNQTYATKYQVAIMQQSSITSSYDVPYIDNFQYINAFTRQASVNELNFFTACELSGELVDNNNVYYDNGKVYDRRFVNTGYGINPTLKIDTVTLNDSDTLQASDDDIDEADEDLNWDDDDLDNDDLDSEEEVEENPYTIAALNEVGTINSGVLNQITAYDNLTPEDLDRVIADSPQLQVILSQMYFQINNIVTDSQQDQQHIIF